MSIDRADLSPSSTIDAMTLFRLEAINMQSTFEELVELVNRNPELLDAFKAHIAQDPKAIKMFQEYQYLAPQDKRKHLVL